ncbi:hypothetical protein BB561_005037 [Smittium simulii]|uniref:Transcription initiation factor IIF subunit beta n=1 Tax=Smittium simulii TaxID=133385 RepID=A0A2T9YCL3_9FUNG|nr:hypothetical protein BB561_005037 [Smittium simulii]
MGKQVGDCLTKIFSKDESAQYIEQDDTINEYPKSENGGSMDDEVDELNIAELDTRVWLVKVPEFLAKKWREQKDSGIELGKIRIYNTPDEQGKNISLLLEDDNSNKNLPKEYHLNVINKTVKNMFVFSEDRDPDEELKPTSLAAYKNVSTSLVGTIHHECTVEPKLDEQYQEIMRQRVFNASKSVRTVQILGGTHKSSNLFSPGLTSKNAIFGSRRKGLLGNTDLRTERMPRNELIDMLFGAFEKYQYWTFKGLVEYSRQPSTFLKEVLSDIAILNKRGPYSSMYSLKPEFSMGNTNSISSINSNEVNTNSVYTNNQNNYS